MRTFIIAEAACTWNYGNPLATAERSIEAAKACGADAWKAQWTSNPAKMAQRRGMPEMAEKYQRLAWPDEWHRLFKAMCDEAGIEYMCTVYIPEDIPVIAPLVKRFKVSAYEAMDWDFVESHGPEAQVFMSLNPGKSPRSGLTQRRYLHCISKYPCPPEALGLSIMKEDQWYDGLSDHTGHTFIGALAVAAGASIIEVHMRLSDTPETDPDYPHSHRADGVPVPELGAYIANVRMAEKVMG